MRIFFAILFAPLFASASWIESAYPWQTNVMFGYSNRVTTSAWVRAGATNSYATWSNQQFAVVTRWGDTSAVWTASNRILQARDAWQHDGYSAAWERVLPVTPAPGGVASFVNAPFPQENWRAQERLKDWLESYIPNFVAHTAAVSGVFDDWFHANSTNNAPPMWGVSNLLSFVGAPSNWFAYTPLDPRMKLGAATTVTYRIYCTLGTNCTTTNTYTNTVVDPWGPRDAPVIQTNTITGTNGQLVAVAWSNGPVAAGFTSDDYVAWRFSRQLFTNCVWTYSAISLQCPMSNEVGTAGRAWETMYGSRAGIGGGGGCASNCSDAEAEWIFDQGCPGWPYAYRSNSVTVTTNYEGEVWYADAYDCVDGAQGSRNPTYDVLDSCIPVGQVPTDVRYPDGCHSVDAGGGNSTNIYYVWTHTEFTCETAGVTNQEVCIDASRYNSAMIWSDQYTWVPRDSWPDLGANDWLWGYRNTNLVATVDIYFQFFASNGVEYVAENDAGNISTGLAHYATFTNQPLVTNTWPMIAASGKINPLTAPPKFCTLTNIPYAGWCETTNARGWFMRGAGAAIHKWVFEYK